MNIDGVVIFEVGESELAIKLLRMEFGPRFGGPEYRCLVLRGKMRIVRTRPPRFTRSGVRIRDSHGTGKVYLPGLVPTHPHDSSLCHVHFDNESNIPDTVQLVKLFEDSHWVLAVEATEGEGEYERVGIGDLGFSGWFDKVFEETFTLL